MRQHQVERFFLICTFSPAINALSSMSLIYYFLIWRRERDSNPRYVAVYTLSRRAPSTARPSLPMGQAYTGQMIKSTLVLIKHITFR